MYVWGIREYSPKGNHMCTYAILAALSQDRAISKVSCISTGTWLFCRIRLWWYRANTACRIPFHSALSYIGYRLRIVCIDYRLLTRRRIRTELLFSREYAVLAADHSRLGEMMKAKYSYVFVYGNWYMMLFSGTAIRQILETYLQFQNLTYLSKSACL